MPPRKPDKNKQVLKDLEKTISPVLVVNNSSLKPYVELFEYEPENIYQQPLGSLIGFFEVKEYSQESAYVVNFLTSVLKKEYYINPKRQVTESLDSALHKVNLALSELAKNGNVEWLGKIHAAICVLEKNNAHFSVSGDAKIFLYRNKTLSEISADLASDSIDPHPLKTFVNVSSGRLEKNDRMLITSEDIFHILPAVEIKKNFQRFQDEKFVQFLKTALSNQLEMIASIVVDLSEAIPVAKTKKVTEKAAETFNAFSQAAFTGGAKASAALENQEFNEEKEPEDEPTVNYTDKKTGHIYIQGGAQESTEGANAQISLYLDLAKEKISQGSYIAKNEIRKRFSLYKKQLAKKRELRRLEKERLEQLALEQAKLLEEQHTIEEAQRAERLAQEKDFELARLEQERIEQEKLALENAAAEKILQKKSRAKQKAIEKLAQAKSPERELSFKEKLELAKMEQQKNAVIDLRAKNEPLVIEEETYTEEEISEPTIYEEISTSKPANLQQAKIALDNLAEKTLPVLEEMKNKSLKFVEKIKAKNEAQNNKEAYTQEKQKSKLSKIVPHFSKIKNLFSRFSPKQKLYTLGAFGMVFIVPLFIVHFLNKSEATTTTQLSQEPPIQNEKLATEKNINLNTQAKTIYSNTAIVANLIALNNPALITKNAVVILQNEQPKEFPLPTDSGTAVRASFMNDLSLILILTDTGKVLSFSPISTKFTENKIDLATTSPESFVGTYLTYLYVLDQKSNQIYRYPRAEGGFGERTSWLKDTTSLKNASNLAIDDNVYIVQDNQVLKFFKGKAMEFKLEESATAINFDQIYTKPELKNLYVLDKENARLITYSKEGSIVSQSHNDLLSEGSSLSVDEQKNLAYITTTSGLISISIQ